MHIVMAENKPEVVQCNQCGHTWEPRVWPPQCCPRCKRYDWNEPKKGESSAAD